MRRVEEVEEEEEEDEEEEEHMVLSVQLSDLNRDAVCPLLFFLFLFFFSFFRA